MIALVAHSYQQNMGFISWCILSSLGGLLFGRFSLGPPFEECHKMADLSVFAKFAITRRCGHFWSSGLRQKVVVDNCACSAYILADQGICAGCVF